MDVGSDFLLSRTLSHGRWKRWLGVSLLSLGLLLLVGSGSYYLYARQARADLPGLEVNKPVTAVPTAANADSNGASVASLYIPASRFSSVYPGQDIHPKYWDSPYWAEEYQPAGWDLIKQFEPVRPEDVEEAGTLNQDRATRIQIPAIDLDSDIRELRIVQLGDSAAWETPANIVGHIPTTANTGEVGRGYFFGHLESPIGGGGNVFFRLPEIPKLLQQGEEVHVIFTSASGDQYLYKVFQTTVVHQDDLRLEESSDPLVSLVACVPRLVYDHRLVVTGELVGIKRA